PCRGHWGDQAPMSGRLLLRGRQNLRETVVSIRGRHRSHPRRIEYEAELQWSRARRAPPSRGRTSSKNEKGRRSSQGLSQTHRLQSDQVGNRARRAASAAWRGIDRGHDGFWRRTGFSDSYRDDSVLDGDANAEL